MRGTLLPQALSTVPAMPSRALSLALLALMCASSLGNATQLAANTSVASANSSRCDEDLLFQKLYVLMPAINQCAKEADYYINTDKLALPTDGSLTKFCKSENCTKLSNELEAAGLPSCTVAVGTAELPLKDFFAQIKTQCAASSSKSSGAKSAATTRWRALSPVNVVCALVALVCATSLLFG